LRLLTLGALENPLSDDHIDALLASAALARRLEYLALNHGRFGRSAVHRIMHECTSLLALAIGDHANARFRPVTEGDWRDLTHDVPFTPAELHARSAERRTAIVAIRVAKVAAQAEAVRGSVGVFRLAFNNAVSFASRLLGADQRDDQQVPDEPLVQLDLGLFLTAPVDFRRRVRYLSLGSARRSEECAVQCRRRYPNLIHIRFCFHPYECGYPEPVEESHVEEDELASAQQFGWLERESSAEASSSPSSASSTRASVIRRRRQFKLTPMEMSHLHYSPFHFVRALKEYAGLPLSPSELNPLNRCWPSPPVLGHYD
jgi:hypothetical protein